MRREETKRTEQKKGMKSMHGVRRQHNEDVHRHVMQAETAGFRTHAIHLIITGHMPKKEP